MADNTNQEDTIDLTELADEEYIDLTDTPERGAATPLQPDTPPLSLDHIDNEVVIDLGVSGSYDLATPSTSRPPTRRIGCPAKRPLHATARITSTPMMRPLVMDVINGSVDNRPGILYHYQNGTRHRLDHVTSSDIDPISAFLRRNRQSVAQSFQREQARVPEPVQLPAAGVHNANIGGATSGGGAGDSTPERSVTNANVFYKNKYAKNIPDSPCSKEGQCPICMNSYSKIKSEKIRIVATECGHVYCENCLKQVILTSRTCPTCRKCIRKKNPYMCIYI